MAEIEGQKFFECVHTVIGSFLFDNLYMNDRPMRLFIFHTKRGDIFHVVHKNKEFAKKECTIAGRSFIICEEARCCKAMGTQWLGYHPLQHSTKLPAIQVCIDDFPGKKQKIFHHADTLSGCRKSGIAQRLFVQKWFLVTEYLVDIEERRRLFEGKKRA
ncbi:MAG: hypothetical protein IIU00_04605, partial [Clostridia bacterium]|nr:hypothetical protein [Clostridia bacterium]